MKYKRICELLCTADLRIDVCNLRIGHKKENPVNVCLRCKPSKVVFTKRGEKFKQTFESQCRSWEKQFGDKI